MDVKAFFDFLLHQNRKKYDMPQVVNSALDMLDNIPLLERGTQNTEDFSGFFCSELAASGLEVAGAIKSLNASEVTPIDLCSFKIYANDYFQMKGGEKRIGGFNTLIAEGWGE